jgi:hypothetical protein
VARVGGLTGAYLQIERIYATRVDPDQHLAGLRRWTFDGCVAKWLLCAVEDGGMHLR